MATALEHGRAPNVREALEAAKVGKLLGRRCTACGQPSFVDHVVCPHCKGQQFAAFESSGHGEIVSFTIIGFPAESFDGREPYAYVIVKMAEGAQAAGWMPGVRDPPAIPPGTKVKVVAAPDGLGLAFAKE
jgi:uncharacterized OB-fold protein